MNSIMSKTQFAEKRCRDKLKNNKKQRFNRKTKKQLNKTHTVSQHMYKKKNRKYLKNHEFEIEKSRISKRKQKKEK